MKKLVQVRDQVHFGSGVLFVVMGALAAALSMSYRLGVPSRMGSGFFPLLLSILLILLGLWLIWNSCNTDALDRRIERLQFKPIAVVLISQLLFAVTMPVAGFFAASIVLVVSLSFVKGGLGFKYALLNAVVLTVLSILIFVYGLGLQIRVFPSF